MLKEAGMLSLKLTEAEPLEGSELKQTRLAVRPTGSHSISAI